MNKKILLGTEDFAELIRENGYYVDKTELLYDLAEETTNKVTLFTRPRRFGKTLTMSMLGSFFDIRRDSRELFQGLRIQERHPEFCREWMNQYPVLFLSLKDVDGLSFDSALKKLKMVIADFCRANDWLENAEQANRFDRELFIKLESGRGEPEEVQNSLKMIMRMMNEVYGKPVILLLDEYDVPLAKAYANGYYVQMLDVVRGLMSASLKTNEFLKFAVITGCLRIPKESIFTGVNNFASYSVLDDDFSEYFGFTQSEMEELLKYYDREDKIETAKNWYDGYVFGNTQIYCPWDAMSYTSALRRQRDAKPKPYWENTSGNDAIRAFFSLDHIDISDKFETLLNGGSITENVTNALTYDEAYDSEDHLWSVLLMTGYVTAVSQETPDDSMDDAEEGVRGAELRIPNREIAKIFQKAVVDHFKRSVEPGRIHDLMDALWSRDEEKASEILSDLLWNTISYMVIMKTIIMLF